MLVRVNIKLALELSRVSSFKYMMTFTQYTLEKEEWEKWSLVLIVLFSKLPNKSIKETAQARPSAAVSRPANSILHHSILI